MVSQVTLTICLIHITHTNEIGIKLHLFFFFLLSDKLRFVSPCCFVFTLIKEVYTSLEVWNSYANI